ncbi:hypothetical protein KCP71_04785 [Salmonella enterica subsp. enterica]|nr:hypothetical protein KCP71_04785 [Salmonella enterica subsp. enterica]
MRRSWPKKVWRACRYGGAVFSGTVPEVFRCRSVTMTMRAEFRLWHDGDDLYHIMFDQQTKSGFALTPSGGKPTD